MIGNVVAVYGNDHPCVATGSGCLYVVESGCQNVADVPGNPWTGNIRRRKLSADPSALVAAGRESPDVIVADVRETAIY